MIRKIFTVVALAIFVATGANAQLLYKISGNGLAEPSYIIGTHHLANVAIVNTIPGVMEALTDCHQVYGEVVWDDMINTDSVKFMQKAMTLPDGQSLKTVLTDEQYKKLDAFIVKMMSVGLSQPQVNAQMGRLTPAALLAQLTVLMYLQNHMGAFDPSSTFDQYFQAQAKKNNEPVGGLETLAFQTDLLYNGASIERQVEQLMGFLDNTQFYADQMEKITDAFYEKDLDALKAAMDMKLGKPCDSTPEEEAALIGNRNAAWVAKMPAIMSATPTFFAVGAGHLPGAKGVLQLLKDAGYTVEAVQ